MKKKTMRKKEKNGKSFHYYEINRYHKIVFKFQRFHMDYSVQKFRQNVTRLHPLSKLMATVIVVQ